MLELSRTVDIAVDQQRPAQILTHALEVFALHVLTLQLSEVHAAEGRLHGENVGTRL